MRSSKTENRLWTFVNMETFWKHLGGDCWGDGGDCDQRPDLGNLQTLELYKHFEKQGGAWDGGDCDQRPGRDLPNSPDSSHPSSYPHPTHHIIVDHHDHNHVNIIKKSFSEKINQFKLKSKWIKPRIQTVLNIFLISADSNHPMCRLCVKVATTIV